MRRRRPFRRRPRLRWRPMRHPGGAPLQPRARQALARAIELMEDEEFAKAAGTFGHLSERAQQSDMLVRAAHLALQASRAHFAAGDVASASTWAKRGLRLFIQTKQLDRIPVVLSRIIKALRERGYSTEADELEQETAQMLKEMGLSLDELAQHIPQPTGQRGTLPARCSGCGAPLVPAEVEWHDANTAGCIFCGTIAKAT